MNREKENEINEKTIIKKESEEKDAKIRQLMNDIKKQTDLINKYNDNEIIDKKKKKENKDEMVINKSEYDKLI